MARPIKNTLELLKITLADKLKNSHISLYSFDLVQYCNHSNRSIASEMFFYITNVFSGRGRFGRCDNHTIITYWKNESWGDCTYLVNVSVYRGVRFTSILFVRPRNKPTLPVTPYIIKILNKGGVSLVMVLMLLMLLMVVVIRMSTLPRMLRVVRLVNAGSFMVVVVVVAFACSRIKQSVDNMDDSV